MPTRKKPAKRRTGQPGERFFAPRPQEALTQWLEPDGPRQYQPPSIAGTGAGSYIPRAGSQEAMTQWLEPNGPQPHRPPSVTIGQRPPTRPAWMPSEEEMAQPDERFFAPRSQEALTQWGQTPANAATAAQWNELLAGNLPGSLYSARADSTGQPAPGQMAAPPPNTAAQWGNALAGGLPGSLYSAPAASRGRPGPGEMSTPSPTLAYGDSDAATAMGLPPATRNPALDATSAAGADPATTMPTEFSAGYSPRSQINMAALSPAVRNWILKDRDPLAARSQAGGTPAPEPSPHPEMGSQGAYGMHTGQGGYVFGRPTVAAEDRDPGYLSGNTSKNQQAYWGGKGYGVSSDPTLPMLPGGAPRLQPEKAAYLGPETRQMLAYSPEALADLETRAAASRERLGLGAAGAGRGEFTASQLGAKPIKAVSEAKAAREAAGKPRTRRANTLPADEVAIMRQHRAATGRPMSITDAKIQARINRGEELTPAMKDREQQRQIASLPPEARGRVMAEKIKADTLASMQAEQLARTSTPGSRLDAINAGRRDAGLPEFAPAPAGTPLGDLPLELQVGVTSSPDVASARQLLTSHGYTGGDVNRMLLAVFGEHGYQPPADPEADWAPVAAAKGVGNSLRDYWSASTSAPRADQMIDAPAGLGAMAIPDARLREGRITAEQHAEIKRKHEGRVRKYTDNQSSMFQR